MRCVRESRKGVGRGFVQPGPAKHPGDLLTGIVHKNQPPSGSWFPASCARSVPCPEGNTSSRLCLVFAGLSRTVFVLAASVRAPLPGLAISNGLFPGLAGVVKTLADEHGPSGIRINGLLPVRIATDRVRQVDALLGDPDEVRARLSQSIPLRRYGEPAEFGHVAAFVLSPAASYITGAMIPIDGGAIRSI